MPDVLLASSLQVAQTERRFDLPFDISFTGRKRMVLRTMGRLLLCGALLFTVGLLTARAEDKKENTATKPVPRDEKWKARHEGFVAQAKKGGIDLLFLGDSITDAWGGEGHGANSKGAK